MVHFQDCKALTDLNLAGTKVSDVGLAHFKDCKNLKYLCLDRTQVGDAGLAQLKGMPLRVLWIYNTGITDLTPLQGMPLEEDPPDPEEHHQGPGHSPRHEEPQNHRHRLDASLAGGGVLGALRQGGIQGVAWRSLPTVLLAAIPVASFRPVRLAAERRSLCAPGMHAWD